ncbi:MAG TPA: hypothetical protein VMS76_13740 [Planctomycetota bacterium]|nr:hypothetical protein [Planctomycetota bacterium]
MTESTVRSILRIVAMVTILIGNILTTSTFVGLLATRSTLQGATMDVQVSGVVAEMGFYAVLGHALVIGWGLVLYATSPRLARHIVS